MQTGADPQSLSVSIGRAAMVALPREHMPQKLDWERWVLNMSVRFEHFERPAPRRIFLLDHGERDPKVGTQVGSLTQTRDNLQSIDLFSVVGSWSETTLALTHGEWHFGISSWLESYRHVCVANFAKDVGNLLQEQIGLWHQISEKLKDDSLFLLSDSGSRFVNVSEFCHSWLERVIRSRVVPEPKAGAWAAGAFLIHAPGEGLGRKIRLHRVLVLEPSAWCGDPSWHLAFQAELAPYIASVEECWVSMPSATLTLDIESRLQLLRESPWQLKAPSSVTGWHPLRDFVTFMSIGTFGAMFVYMDGFERLHFLIIEDGGGQT